jgi:nucleotide-binding universal stress UspA family protein
MCSSCTPTRCRRTYFDRRLGDARRRGATALQELLHKHRSKLPVADYIDELLGGPPAEAINHVARARDAHAIVIGYSGAGRLRAVVDVSLTGSCASLSGRSDRSGTRAIKRPSAGA